MSHSNNIGPVSGWSFRSVDVGCAHQDLNHPRRKPVILQESSSANREGFYLVPITLDKRPHWKIIHGRSGYSFGTVDRRRLAILFVDRVIDTFGTWWKYIDRPELEKIFRRDWQSKDSVQHLFRTTLDGR